MVFRTKPQLIRKKSEWDLYLSKSNDLSSMVIQNLKFSQENVEWKNLIVNSATFLGCSFKKEDAIFLISQGAFLYPKFDRLPYNPHRTSLYTWTELMQNTSGSLKDTVDYKIYNHFKRTKHLPSIEEALAQRIHDYSIDVALRNIVDYDKDGMTQQKIVGFMGGHSTKRGSEYYIKVAMSAKKLSERGYFIATGGGPGVMEAANLGAYFGNKTDNELSDAIEILSDLEGLSEKQKDYTSKNYFKQSEKVLEKYPDGKKSLAIPTWFYGHEPSNVFASHIAKYFSNSIREDTLLAICLHGIVYAPGSAGTTQEIFQEAAQNHYGTYGFYSPMVFLGVKRYTEDTALYSTLHQLANNMKYKQLLHLTDHVEDVVTFIESNPPLSID